ncbi:MAG: zinc ABC transporter substrate-binding protein [Sedimentisphaerales bacterium]|nr:zinc ABC transporter substrate-binding protein [Sedimentisphaerales bacterium]
MKSRAVHPFFWVLALSLAAVLGCKQKQEPSFRAEVTVTNTYLQSAVRDLAGKTNIFCLAPPGMCPGHFDLSPEQIRSLLQSRILFRFDFQAGLDDKLNRVDSPIVEIAGRPGMCIPRTYLETCHEMVPFLETHLPDSSLDYRDNYRLLETRLIRFSEQIQSRVKESDFFGKKTIASRHQADFIQWLGLEVVATFRSAEVMTPAEIENCLRVARNNAVQIVIANAQEGTTLPRHIAEQLNARLVVFSNFPDTTAYPENAFEQLVRSNLNQLIESY